MESVLCAKSQWVTLVQYLEAAVILRDAAKVSILVSELEESTGYLTSLYLTSVARHVGSGLALLGQSSEARSNYEDAIRVSAKVGFRPEVALSRLQLAELLLEHYPDERDAAIEHLDFAIAEFQAMKMQPSLERALSHRGLLKA